MPSPPAFQFYADDFFAGVATMTDAEAGIYIRLICLAWSKGLLNERALRAATFDGDIDLARKVLAAKFIQNEEGYWFNERLEKVREIQQFRTRAGSKGGSTTQANAKQTPSKSPTFASGFASEAKVKPPSPVSTLQSPTPSPTSTPDDMGAAPPVELKLDRVSSDDIATVVTHYKKIHPKAKPGLKERKMIAARIKDGYSSEQLCEAIDGCHETPHNCGENDRGQKYQTLSIIMRSSDQVMRFIEGLAMKDDPVLSTKSQATSRAAQSFLSHFGGGT